MKAYLALHQVYGVDLNATAVELAEISLWLDTMVEGLAGALVRPAPAARQLADRRPQGGLHPRAGRGQVLAQGGPEAGGAGLERPGRGAVDQRPRSRTSCCPPTGWGAAADVGKDIKDLVPDAVARLKDWRRSMRAKPTKKQVDALVEMAQRVETLWEIATRRLAIAEQPDPPRHRRSGVATRRAGTSDRHVTREEIEESLADPDGAYRRLRLVMDAWCALWFWPLTEDDVEPPTLEQWYDALRMILGGDTMRPSVAKRGDDTLESRADLGRARRRSSTTTASSPAPRAIDEVLDDAPVAGRLPADRRAAGLLPLGARLRPVFVDRGGFDLQVGNPPWVRPDWDARRAGRVRRAIRP